MGWASAMMMHVPRILMGPMIGAISQALMRKVGLVRAKRQELQILDGCSGTLRPGRLTLLLGGRRAPGRAPC